MILTHLARFVAICLSIAAACISVIGLAAIFSGAVLEVSIIAALLESAKVISAVWLHGHWKYISSNIKIYLSVAVIVLMGITSIGIYGFFARAHIKQQVAMETGEVAKIPALEAKIKIEREKIEDAEKQVLQIDSALSAITEKGRARDAKFALTETKKQREDRNKFLVDKAKSLEVIGGLEAEKAQIDAKVKQYEVEVGPLKYVAALIYGSDATKEQLEHSVRILIMVLVFVFDPLAIALLVAANTFSLPPKQHMIDGGEDVDDENVTNFPKLAKRKYTKRRLENPLFQFPKKREKRKVLDLSDLELI